jgi:predicted phage tail protein
MLMPDAEQFPDIIGAKGGGGGGKKGGGGSSSEADNTLQSNARARIAELISEGPTEGLVGGLKGIYFDGTPVQNEDGSFNFEGVTYEERFGLPDQAHINGLPMVETPFSVETEVKLSTGPVVRRILEENADAVRVIIRIPALVSYDDKGQLKPATVHYGIQVRALGGDWIEPVSQLIENQKTTSPWEISHRIELPRTGGPWDIRVISYTPEPKDSKTQNQIFWESYVVVTEGKFTYPNSAYVFFEINAKQFGSNLPGRSYKYRGIKVQVPANYDPVARTYAGIWNGTFKTAWTNNPAWVFYDLIVNDRYGLGEFIDASKVDKWTLYNIAKYCDEMIPSGYKTQDGADIFEPRFTFNGVINTRAEAYEVLKNVTNAFRGMAFWALGQTYAVADIPADPIKLVTPANVIGGKFSYSGTSKKSRHSVALVTWNDQDDLGRPATELVINPELLQRFGWRETSITKHGCTSRGEAHRFGRWILDTEQHETDTIKYTAGWDHAELRPFDIIAVADPAKAEVRAGGRVERVSGSTVVLDAAFDPTIGGTRWLTLTMPDGKLEKREIISISGKSVTVSGAFSRPVPANAVYIISSTEVNPRQYRVLTVSENEDGNFDVMALFHDPLKYARVEYGLNLDPISYTRPGSTVPAPTNLQAVENQYVENSVPFSKILFSFTPGSQLAVSHSVVVNGPKGIEEFTGLTNPSIEIHNVEAGTYTFEARSYSARNIASQSAFLTYEATGWTGGETLAVRDLRTVEGGAIFNSSNCILTWRNVIPEGAQLYQDNVVTIFDRNTNEILRQEAVVGTTFNYSFEKNQADAVFRGKDPFRSFRVEVTVRDKTGRESPPASLVVANPVPATPVPQAEPGYGQIYLYWLNPKDNDFAGTLVWVDEYENFEPVYDPADIVNPSNQKLPLYDTMASEVVIKAFTTKYIRIGCYDTFGKSGISITPAIKVEPLNFLVDVEPPAKPTGLTFSSSLNEKGEAVVEATWNSNTEDDLAQYDLEIAFYQGNFMSIPTSSNFYTFTCLPGTLIRGRLRARDVSGNGSYYTDVVEHIAAADTVPPETPVNVTAKTSFKSIWLSWDNNTEADLMRYEVFVGEADAAPGENPDPVYFVTANSFVFTDLTAGATRYLWVRARDTSGNVSDWSEMITAKTVTIEAVDIATEQLNLPVIVDELPLPITETTPKKVTLSTDLNVYVQYQDDWILETDARNITGSLIGSQIGDGEITDVQIGPLSISTPLLRSNSVKAKKIEADAIESRHIKADVIEGRHVKADAIDSQHVKANAVTADHIAAEAIYGRHIGAEQISGEKIKANSIQANHLAAKNVITLSAQIADAIIDDAKITNIDAAKIRAGSVMSGEVIVGGTQLGVVKNNAQLGAQDPATRINAGSTTIQPGKILIAGATSLSNWIKGGDSTRIDGGMISAGTVNANTLVAGLRNITVSGVEFQNVGNSLYWTAGQVATVNDWGSRVETSVSSGSTSWYGSTVYIYWSQGASYLNATTSASVAFSDQCVVIATYDGGPNINADYGRTIIDGSKIKTGTIEAQQIATNAIAAQNIQAGAINSTHISAESISSYQIRSNQIRADHIQAGAINAGHIQASSISTDKLTLGGVTVDRIANGAVTAAVATTTTSPYGGSVGIYVDVACTLYMSMSATYAGGTGDNPSEIYTVLYIDGQGVWGVQVNGFQKNSTISHATWVGAGWHTVEVGHSQQPGHSATNTVILAMGLKR